MKKTLIIKGKAEQLTFEQVMEKFNPLCQKFSRRMFIDGYEKDDLLQVCYIALHRAYTMYDIQKQIDFLTLSYGYINNDFKRLIRDSKNLKRNTDNYTFIGIHQKTGFSSESTTYAEVIPDKVDIENEIIQSDLITIINESLTEDEKLMLPVLMGLKTQLQYGKEVGITGEGARRRINKLQLKLKQKLTSKR